LNPEIESRSFAPRLLARLGARLGRIWVRLLLVNVVVVLVPVAGLEFARIYEKQLLYALEHNMNDQAALTRAVLEDGLRRGIALDDSRHRDVLHEAAKSTRMRVRVIGTDGAVLADSHGEGAPEGPEPEPPRLLPLPPRGAYSESREAKLVESSSPGATEWPRVADRREVKSALAGGDATQTRIARHPKAVFLFSATPVFRTLPEGGRAVAGAVYVTRSTTPVLLELYRIRSGLFRVLAVALALSIGTTLLLALSISKPLARLSKAAKRIAAGERGVPLPGLGSGEIRELSESFRTMTEKLDQRLAYISEFSADVAHEFKSPLTSIRGAAELLAEGAHSDAEARERFLKNILLDSERLDRLVSRLLLLSRIEASADEMTLVDLRALLDRLARRAGERGPVELAYTSKHSWVRGRESDLETALGNLVENAQRYSPPDRAVRVVCEDVDRGTRVSVCDEGPGIPEARRGKVFERFYTTDAERGGTGLGLAIVDSVARAHGGRLTLETEVGAGSRFSFWLP
jgi:two-component system, OmpR family, sensor histidine kinase ChvG